MAEEESKRSYEWLTEIVKVSVLGWSAALLTLSYMGYFDRDWETIRVYRDL